MDERDAVKLPFRLHRDQRDALHRLAKERGVSASALLRGAIADMTGVPDPVDPVSRPRSHPWRDADRRREREQGRATEGGDLTGS